MNSDYEKSFKEYTTTIQRLVEQLGGDYECCKETKTYFELYKKIEKKKGLEEITDSAATKKVQIALMKNLADGLKIAINVIDQNTGPKKLTKATNETEKLFSIWSSLVEAERITTTSDKTLKSILTDEKAFEFWNKCLPMYGVSKPIAVIKFNYILSKEYPDKTFWKTDVSDAYLKITPYTLRIAVDCCEGWDNFIDACQVRNPFRALVCTNSRATPTCDETVMNPTDTKRFYMDSTTAGQAPYGSFFILAEADRHKTEEGDEDEWFVLGSVSNSVAAIAFLRHTSEVFPEAWIFESDGKIRTVAGKYLAWSKEDDEIVLCGLKCYGRKRLHFGWRISQGVIYCRDDESSGSKAGSEWFIYYDDGDGNLKKGRSSDGNPVKFKFVNYLPWVTANGKERDDDDDDDDKEEEEEEENDDDDD